MALTRDRNTPAKDAELIAVPVAANAVIRAGALVAANAAGFAVPGSVATTLAYLGRADEFVDNTGGANAARIVQIRRGKAFAFRNHGADPVTQANLGRNCFIVDDEFVAGTNGGNTRSVAGVVVGIDANGVWVE